MPDFPLVHSTARRFLMTAGFKGKFSCSSLYLLMRSMTLFVLAVQVYELITCARQANENGGNLISIVQLTSKQA